MHETRGGSFRPEHRAALDWLNDHTDPDSRFFGVQIEVVQIGDSIPAPNFKLVAQPNDWEKQVKAATSASSLSEKSQLYWAFWDQFRSRVIAEHPGWTKGKTSTPDSWYDLASGKGGVAYKSLFTAEGLTVGLYFEGLVAEINLGRFETLRAMKDQFEHALGEAAVWDEKPGKKSKAVYVPSELGGVENLEQWPAMLDWLLDQHVRFRQAVQAVGGVASFA